MRLIPFTSVLLQIPFQALSWSKETNTHRHTLRQRPSTPRGLRPRDSKDDSLSHGPDLFHGMWAILYAFGSPNTMSWLSHSFPLQPALWVSETQHYCNSVLSRLLQEERSQQWVVQNGDALSRMSIKEMLWPDCSHLQCALESPGRLVKTGCSPPPLIRSYIKNVKVQWYVSLTLWGWSSIVLSSDVATGIPSSWRSSAFVLWWLWKFSLWLLIILTHCYTASGFGFVCLFVFDASWWIFFHLRAQVN